MKVLFYIPKQNEWRGWVMPRARNPDAEKAEALYNKGMKLIDISRELNLPEGTVRRWKSSYKWHNERSDKKANVRNKGGQPNNKNSVGHMPSAPTENKNAEKHGLFSKYLPSETMELVTAAEKMNPLDALWDQITIQYAAIIRAQHIMYVKDKEDSTTTKIGEGFSDSGSSEKWEVQQAWDKQAKFLQAQSRAMTTFSNMIKNYDELLHKNWELATEEQKARIAVLKAKANLDDNGPTENDGFIEALEGKVDDIWREE